MIHDYILDTTKDEEEVKFESSGQCTVSGIPVGKITFIYRRIVTGIAVKKYVSAYEASGEVNFDFSTGTGIESSGGIITIGEPQAPATPAEGGGGWSYDAQGNLVIGTAGGGSATIQKMSSAPYEFKEECSGIENMILGYYTFKGVWKSEHKEIRWGGWAGGG